MRSGHQKPGNTRAFYPEASPFLTMAFKGRNRIAPKLTQRTTCQSAESIPKPMFYSQTRSLNLWTRRGAGNHYVKPVWLQFETKHRARELLMTPEGLTIIPPQHSHS